MSNTSTGNNTMNKSAPSKRVSKKSDTVATVATVTPVTVDKSKKKPTTATATTTTTTTTPTTAPVVSVVETVTPVETKTVEQEIASLIVSQQKIRDEAVANIKTLQRLQKRVAKEVKEAGRRRRRSKKDEDGVPREKRPTIFTTPVTLKDDLCTFLGKSKGSQMTPADVTRAFSAYVDSHKLKDVEKGHTIHPDANMRKVLGVKEGENLTYRNIQSYLYKLYILPEKKKTA